MQTPPRRARRWFSNGLGAVFAGVVAALVLGGGAGVTQAAPVLTLDIDCTPDTIRPHEEALVTCSTTVTNSGDATATDVGVMAMPASGLRLPNYRLFDSVSNGEPVFVSSSQITFDSPDIGSGESVQGRIRVIFGVGEEGSYGFQLDLRQGGQTVDTATVSFEATAGSPYPPTNLVLSKTLITEPATPEPLSPPGSLSPPSSISQQAETAEYELVVRNESDVTMSSVTIFDKHNEGVAVVSADPSATEVNETTKIARWEMGALAPDEEFRVRVIFRGEGDDCVYTGGTMVVTAQAPGAEESYVADSEDGVLVGPGECPEFGLGRGQGGGPGLPSTGAGGAARHGVFWVWLAVALATGGALAIGRSVMRIRSRE